MVTIDDFARIELKVGTVLEAEEVEGSEKLVKLTVDLGEEEPRTILTGIKAWYAPDELKNKQFIFITNLEPKKIMGLESNGMILASDTADGPVLLGTTKPVPAGSQVR